MENTIVRIKCYNTRGNLYKVIKTTFEQGEKLQSDCNSFGCWCTYDKEKHVYKVHGCQADINYLLKTRIEK